MPFPKDISCAYSSISCWFLHRFLLVNSRRRSARTSPCCPESRQRETLAQRSWSPWLLIRCSHDTQDCTKLKTVFSPIPIFSSFRLNLNESCVVWTVPYQMKLDLKTTFGGGSSESHLDSVNIPNTPVLFDCLWRHSTRLRTLCARPESATYRSSTTWHDTRLATPLLWRCCYGNLSDGPKLWSKSEQSHVHSG